MQMTTKPSIVQKLAQQFEHLATVQTNTNEQSKTQKCNWWLDRQESAIDSDEEDEEYVQNGEQEVTEKSSIDEQNFIRDNDSKEEENEHTEILHNETPRTSFEYNSPNPVLNIVQELYETEQSYINTISKGIDDYLGVFNESDLPNSLRGQRNKIFATIERIRDLHQKTIYPRLMECDYDLVEIFKMFCRIIQEDHFYIYVQYAINKKISDKICEINGDYFKEYQQTIDDRLGILSILVQPIQRLPRYRLLMLSLFKELVKQMETEDVKQQIAWCCKAEKHMARLLEIFNESMSINDIIECNDINIMHQGKFFKVNDFDIMDTLKRTFRGRVFLFEKCVVYTETETKDTYQYCGHFSHATSYFEYKEGKSKFRLGTSPKREQQITFNADFNIIQQWIQLLRSMRLQALDLEKKKSDEKYRRKSAVIRRGSQNSVYGSDGSSLTNRTSTASSGSGGSGVSDISSGTLSSATNSLSRTTWYSKLE